MSYLGNLFWHGPRGDGGSQDWSTTVRGYVAQLQQRMKVTGQKYGSGMFSLPNGQRVSITIPLGGAPVVTVSPFEKTGWVVSGWGYTTSLDWEALRIPELVEDSYFSCPGGTVEERQPWFATWPNHPNMRAEIGCVLSGGIITPSDDALSQHYVTFDNPAVKGCYMDPDPLNSYELQFVASYPTVVEIRHAGEMVAWFHSVPFGDSFNLSAGSIAYHDATFSDVTSCDVSIGSLTASTRFSWRVRYYVNQEKVIYIGDPFDTFTHHLFDGTLYIHSPAQLFDTETETLVDNPGYQQPAQLGGRITLGRVGMTFYSLRELDPESGESIRSSAPAVGRVVINVSVVVSGQRTVVPVEFTWTEEWDYDTDPRLMTSDVTYRPKGLLTVGNKLPAHPILQLPGYGIVIDGFVTAGYMDGISQAVSGPASKSTEMLGWRGDSAAFDGTFDEWYNTRWLVGHLEKM